MDEGTAKLRDALKGDGTVAELRVVLGGVVVVAEGEESLTGTAREAAGESQTTLDKRGQPRGAAGRCVCGGEPARSG